MPAALSDPQLLARLVALDTTSSRSNLELAELVAEYLDRPGVTVARHPSPDGRKANLLVRVGPPGDAASRCGLVLSGHMDVVPAREAGWSSDPFTLTDRGDRFVARGSADMKGFLALATNLAREVDPETLAAPLVLLFTYDEEVGTLGARHLVEDWQDGSPVADSLGPLPSAAVIGEPTELRAVRLHKGHLKLRFALTGVSAHSGYPHLGVNAIEAAGRAIVALSALRRELESERVASSRHFPGVPYPALNVGTIAGGSAINVVPDQCILEVGARVLPGMDSSELARRIRERVLAAVGEGALGAETTLGEPTSVPVDTTLLSDSPPLESPAEAPLHRHLCHALEQGCGTVDASGASLDEGVSFATDAGWLSRLGLDCVIFGPGSIEVAHRPDEHMPKADLIAARGHLEGLVDRFCRQRVDG